MAKSVVGIDIDKKGVDELRRMGYDIRLEDAERFGLRRKFDAIIASQVMEHLKNVGLFLNCVKKHLRPNGLFIVSVPNAYGFFHTLGALLGIRYWDAAYETHTHIYNKRCLERVLRLHGFDVIKIEFCSSIHSMKGRLYCKLAPSSWGDKILAISKIRKTSARDKKKEE